jgi:hypothetical protein
MSFYWQLVAELCQNEQKLSQNVSIDAHGSFPCQKEALLRPFPLPQDDFAI